MNVLPPESQDKGVEAPGVASPSSAADTARLEASLREFSRIAARKYRFNRRYRVVLLSVVSYPFVYYFLGALLPFPRESGLGEALYFLYRCSLWLMLFGAIHGCLLWKLGERSRKRVAMLIGELSEDTRAVGAIAHYCCTSQMMVNDSTGLEALLKLLPRVTAADASFISDSQMEALLALLVVENQDVLPSARSPELPLLILKALEEIGDSRAIGPVRRLTTGRRNLLYHEAARECLAVLEKRSKKQDYHRTLLTPASEAPQETLLRAAALSETTPPEQLLRADTGENRQ